MATNFKESIQKALGVSSYEFFVILFVVLGLAGGLLFKNYFYSPGSALAKTNISQVDIFNALDSLAEAEKSTNIGTDVEGNPIPELVAGDTLVAKENFFGGTQSAKKAPTGKIDLNTASKVELMNIPGVGEKTALAIIQFRKSSPFTSIKQMMDIKGIGEKKFEKMKDFIKVK